MIVFEIIFWVCVVEAYLGHLSWWAPLIAFLVGVIVSQIRHKDKQTQAKQVKEALSKIEEKDTDD